MGLSDLPYELRLEIFSHIDNWTNWPDFLAFRHADAVNFRLLNNYPLLFAPRPSQDWQAKYEKKAQELIERYVGYQDWNPPMPENDPAVDSEFYIKALSGFNWSVEEFVLANTFQHKEKDPFFLGVLAMLNIRFRPTPQDSHWRPENHRVWHYKARNAAHILVFSIWNPNRPDTLTVPDELYLDQNEFYQVNSHETFGLPLFETKDYLDGCFGYGYYDDDYECKKCGASDCDRVDEDANYHGDCQLCVYRAKYKHQSSWARMLEAAEETVYFMSGLHSQGRTGEVLGRDVVRLRICLLSLVRRAFWYVTQRLLHNLLQPFIGIQESELVGREDEIKQVWDYIRDIQYTLAPYIWELNRFHENVFLGTDERVEQWVE
ncbi:hypothetical protein BJ508DRAFT_312988 [Ascobolus immersus RN42]|uniref:F-box domain-containing protein n=1 Tax=Ascobolus immersus RN42 TaxID=1160509 RepID=A0A3N4HKA6_ASCIM|nr:hypothetical protein BJ508DRAFT_312988 [Ascobolus immersus RN42]